LHAVFFIKTRLPTPPDSYPKAVSNITTNSPRYSNSKLIPRCGPPGGFDPTVWPLPQDRILGCGPHRGIESYGVAPPAGSNPMVWPPSRGIESYGVAPPAGSNPTVWPSPRDRLPHRGIVQICFESMLLPLKGQSTKKCVWWNNTTQGL
jgi:hypothetical protein